MAGRDGSSALGALVTLAETASEHLALLEDAEARPEVDLAQLSRATLPLLLDAIGAAASAAAQSPELKPAERERLAELARKIEARRARQTQVRAHLEDLAVSWRCTRCGAMTADRASIGASGDPASARLVCRRCGAKSALTEEGRAMFIRIFGAEKLDGARHGFEVDEA